MNRASDTRPIDPPDPFAPARLGPVALRNPSPRRQRPKG